MRRKAKTRWARAASSLPSVLMEKRLMCWLRISMGGGKELSSAFFSSISFETTNEATDAGNETSLWESSIVARLRCLGQRGFRKKQEVSYFRLSHSHRLWPRRHDARRCPWLFAEQLG